MRTKTLALSAVIGMLGSASLMAQANVYSINAVGYINVTLPPGYSIVTCPLICGVSPGVAPSTLVTNDLNVLFPQSSSMYNGASVTSFINNSFAVNDQAALGSWAGGGNDIGLPPGAAVFFQNSTASPMTATFVGTVPQGLLTNTLAVGYNLVGSMVPTSGDMTLNTIMSGGNANGFGDSNGGGGPGANDSLLFWPYAGTGNNPSFALGSWSGGNGPDGSGSLGTPYFTGVTTGFFYQNVNTSFNWVENFTINP